MGNFAGVVNGHFFKEVPEFIDRKRLPGYSSLPTPTFHAWIINILQLKHLWGSPNLVWLLCALGVYFLFPYDLTPSGAAHSSPFSWRFFEERLPIWFVLTIGYNAFWHYTLYFLGWAERPFIPDRQYNWAKVCHNLFYNVTAVIIWVGFENTFAYLWATGRLPYLSDQEAFSTTSGFIRFLLGISLVPAWRDFHFYFAHRLLHFKPIFQQVHSLHHRNTDIEPFAGLTMHPIEHLYYYSCILPSLFFFASPFHFLWNGVHLLLSPGASHSGYEDHFQADGFHYMHHRYFECNYAGSFAGYLDVYFGTFMDRFKEEEAKARADPKATLKGVPSGEFIGYMLSSSACVLAWAWFATQAATSGDGSSISPTLAFLLAFISGFGPVLIACAITIVQLGVAALIQPFQKAPLWQSIFHIAVGNVVCSVPVTMACYLALV